ncbi:hypothetical protein FBD94_01725 [Pedobacter hiemivivus]|uniref:Tetratricopeptide repeat protein n=1 Tax=Pedobacter hiemivivus TaxID=2530454 RepID=A0A4R0NES4_9SPHI|nr:hypothetical protein [Pedobacter hiemivivus]TCC98648.1 hypothetical protein EZ444_05060 [Pedobacter hiemivivus]TKC65297.1 hypothetical protein FBD94_01725 [Pedobacter hiemivivus]
MMNEEKLLTVARYLEGDMELQEKQEFETLLQVDEELKSLLAEYKNVHQTLKMKIAPSEDDKEVEATLAAFGKQYFKDQEHSSARVVTLRPYLRWISVAAILVIGLFVWAPWSVNLYEKYSISKEMSVVERGADTKNNLEKAADLYNAHDFSAASAVLAQEYTLSPENTLVAYYYGITLIETGKENDARSILTKLYEGESVFKYDAAYYIGLSFLKQKDNQQALEWLAKIPQGTANYDKAQELSKKLH